GVVPSASLFARSLNVVLRALDLRRGQFLPRGGAPEIIGAQMHRWTYAVFIASLLYEIDQELAAHSVTMRCRAGGDVLWVPQSGPMRSCGALYYRAEPVVRDAVQVEPMLALSLLDRLVPSAVLQWVGAEHEVMQELRAFLARDLSMQEGAIAALVGRALRESRGGQDSVIPRNESKSSDRNPSDDQPLDDQAARCRSTVASSRCRPEPAPPPAESPVL